eukprot:scaffold19517_cov80-Skeletonema_menzelii.AAC.1
MASHQVPQEARALLYLEDPGKVLAYRALVAGMIYLAIIFQECVSKICIEFAYELQLPQFVSLPQTLHPTYSIRCTSFASRYFSSSLADMSILALQIYHSLLGVQVCVARMV